MVFGFWVLEFVSSFRLSLLTPSLYIPLLLLFFVLSLSLSLSFSRSIFFSCSLARSLAHARANILSLTRKAPTLKFLL